jgi:membrane dipeptidase
MTAAAAPAPTALAGHPAEVHRSAVVCDMLLPWLAREEENPLSVLERFHAAGTTYVSLTLGTDWSSMEVTAKHIAKQTRRFEDAGDRYVLVRRVEDIHRAKREGKIAVGFNFQGSDPLGGDANMVALYYELGIRQMLLCYNQKNLAGDGCAERTDDGLTRYGVRLVEAMNRVGMLIDCSHTGYRTTMDILEMSKAPVNFSHSCVRSLKEHYRNIKDDQIKACAATGGIVGITGVGVFLGENDISTMAYLRHIDHIAQLVGARHVGFALDYVYYEEHLYRRIRNMAERYPNERVDRPIAFFPPERIPELTEGMLRLGYSDDDVLGVLGGNFLRVAEAVWR